MQQFLVGRRDFLLGCKEAGGAAPRPPLHRAQVPVGAGGGGGGGDHKPKGFK
jgi:hypothetical protein